MSIFSYAIIPDITGSLYDLSAHFALFAFFLILCYEGYRRKFPTAVWFLSLAIIVTVTLFGSRLAVFDIASWQLWWKEGILPLATERTSIGVVVFMFPAIWLVKKVLRFQSPFFDTLAFALPVVVILRRLGCLAAACCYGTPTGSDWGLRFMGPSVIRDQHWAMQIEGADRFGAAAVHPVQIYFIIGGILCLILLQKYRNHFKRAGNLTLFSLAFLLAFRFFTEFFRDPATNHQLGDFVLGLKQVQWFLLITVLLLSISIWIRERSKSYSNNLITSPSISRLVFTNLLLFSFVYWMRDGFTVVEKIGIHSFLILSGVALVAALVKEKQYFLQTNGQTALITLLAFFMMSQSYPANIDQSPEGKILTFHGNYNHINLNDPTYNCVQTESGCGGTSCVLADSLNPNGAQYNQFNLGLNVRDFSTIKKRRWRSGGDSTYVTFLTYGFDYQPEFFYDKGTDRRVFRNNFMPYLGWGGSFAEMTVGVRIGNFWGEPVVSQNQVAGEKNFSLAGSVRLGSPDHLYFIGSLENSLAMGASVGSFEVSASMNLRDYSRQRWEYIRFGYGSLYLHASHLYIEPAFNLNKELILTPRFGLSFHKELDDRGREAFRHPSFGIGLQYRMDRRGR